MNHSYSHNHSQRQRPSLTTATWSLIVTLLTLISGVIFTTGTRSAEIDTIKTGLGEARKTAQEAKDQVLEMRGDIKVIRTILEERAKPQAPKETTPP